jgi:uncharacterized membrane protein YgcG
MRPLFLILLLFATSAAAGAGRTLYWRALDVSAELDGDGRLHVRERHTMVFNGAWNGGERQFRVESGQRLKLLRVAQVDPAGGATRVLAPGDLSAVGQYKLSGDHVLRWRSRLPSDPPFRDTGLVVEIEYVLSNILQPRDDGLLLDHDFAFPKREGRIERYTLDFRWDPAWRTDSRFTGRLELKNLPPGRGVVLSMPFHYVAAGAPAGVRWPLAAEWRYGLLLALLGFIGWRVVLFRRHEQRHGRYAPLLPVARIDKDWLEKNIFCLAPEVAGAAWDKTTAAPEVAAVLARMSLEGKIASEVKKRGYWLRKRKVLHLRLLCKRQDLQGHESDLVEALFVGGDETDTDRIREHYRQRGFNPADSIRSTLAARVKRLRRGDAAAPTFHLSLFLFLGALVATVTGMLQDPDRALIGSAGAGIGLLVSLVAMLVAQGYDQRVLGAPAIGIYYFIPLAALTAALVYLTLATQHIFDAWTLAGLGLLCAACVNSQLNLMRSRDTPAFTGLRKRLMSARRYFQRELRAPNPRLQDGWLPYLLAFGLGPHVDKWFRAYGGAGRGMHDSGFSTGASTARAAGTQATSNWSGGGGTFAGAGATGTWVAAVGGMAASIPAPSSGSGSSSGGGGGGGGGSSGGGGGGGW